MVAKRWSSISSGNKVICVCPSTKLETPSIPFRKEFIISHEEEPFGTEQGSSVLAPAEENDFEQIELSTLDSLLERCKNTCSESPIRYKQCSSQGTLRKLGYYHIFRVFEYYVWWKNWDLIHSFSFSKQSWLWLKTIFCSREVFSWNGRLWPLGVFVTSIIWTVNFED